MVEVKYSVYFLQPVPRFGGVVEVEVLLKTGGQYLCYAQYINWLPL